jgi:hypothetical protein
LLSKWIADAFANYQFIQKNLVCRAATIEFDRDWNLETSSWESKLTGNTP